MAETRAKVEAPALAKGLDRRVGDLRRLSRRAFRTGDVEAVHHARVTTRRLKAALDVVGPLLPRRPTKAFSKSLRRLRRALGPLRDLDVMLAHLDEFPAPAGCEPAARWVSSRMRQRRSALRREHAVKAASDVAREADAWAELRPHVAAADEDARELLRQTGPEQLGRFSERADRLVQRPLPDAPTPAPPAEPPRDADNIHELRIAGKLLRYTLELASVLGFAVPDTVASQFKKLQDALGLWHDFAVLADESLRLALDEELGTSDPATFGCVLQLARSFWERSQSHLAEFQRLWREGGAGLTRQVLESFAAAGGGQNGSPA